MYVAQLELSDYVLRYEILMMVFTVWLHSAQFFGHVIVIIQSITEARAPQTTNIGLFQFLSTSLKWKCYLLVVLCPKEQEKCLTI